MDRAAVVDWLKAYMHAWETYSPDAIGDVAVVNGRSRYFKDSSRTEPTKEWDNLFVIEFDEVGRCRSFREWYVSPRGQID